MTNFNKASVVLTIFISISIFLLMPQKIVAQSLLTPDLLSDGFKKFRESGNDLIASKIDFNFRNKATKSFLKYLPVAGPVISAVDEVFKEQQQILANQISSARNDIEKEKLQIFKEQLDVQISMLKTSKDQYSLAQNVFIYQKEKDNSNLRKLDYSFRPNKLVVVIADFSDGKNGQGVQVADEIYSNLIELRKECGIDFEILNGEIKDGYVIRNEEAARDVGQHFPVGTGYVVIWGSMSPKTVGMFRPNITFVLKSSIDIGVSNSYTIDLKSKELPLQKNDPLNERKIFSDLVSFACSAIPSCYASFEFACERVPDFEKLYKYLGKSNEGKKEADMLKEKVKDLNRWPDLRKTVKEVYGKKESFEYLTRLTSVEKDTGYPRFVLNKKDRTIMTLILDGKDSAKPVVFDDEKIGKYICYIDTNEVTWGSFANRYNFLSLREKDYNPLNKNLNFVPFKEFLNLGSTSAPFGNHYDFKKDQSEFAVSYISYTGAELYCNSAGKSLPRKVEWEKAAQGAKSVPNKNQFPNLKIKDHDSDVSYIGCFDMAGNVAEWCEASFNIADNKYTIFGVNDTFPAQFGIEKSKQANHRTMDPLVGFRGVVRIPIGK